MGEVLRGLELGEGQCWGGGLSQPVLSPETLQFKGDVRERGWFEGWGQKCVHYSGWG